MREASFVEQNKEKWRNIESHLKDKRNVSPDQLAEDYLQLTNDLAYAQTFYPNSKTKEYLNALAIHAHQSIYRDKKSSKSQFIHFFKEEVPARVYAIRRQLLYSFLIFSLATAIGILSAHYDTTFVRLILGDAYVDTTIRNISSGNPAAIYESSETSSMFLGITTNNIRVAFLCFAMGIFLSIGTGVVLFINGIMLGAFHYLFYQYGVLPEAMSAIWIHGTIEISVIVIAGACGLTLGNSFLFPRSYRRIDSFKMQIKNATLILASTIPLFIIAGFLESYVTRHYQYSPYLSVLIILLSLLLMVFYYIYYPFKKYAQKRHGEL